MKVLSLFDGMSCGQIALERAGIPVEKYYASEIDQYAIKVTQKNYPNTIHIGDVRKIDGHECDVDLVLGGSPCQGFSFAGNQLNFDDPRSKLLFEYVRIWEESRATYFLLENVKMKQEYQNIISDMLGVQPIEINSNLVSAQNRKRLYWTNIPCIKGIEDRELFLKDVVDYNPLQLNFTVGHIKDFLNANGIPDSEQKYNLESSSLNRFIKSTRSLHEKANCMTATMFKGMASNGITNVIIDNFWRKLTPIECERLQTVPEYYTDCVSNTQRYKMLGNGWTVDIIAHILKGIAGPTR